LTTATGVDRLASVLAWFRQSAEGCQKIQEDLARYREIIWRTHAQVVVESGTGAGTSALWFANQGCRVVTVDLEPWSDDSTRQAWGDRVTQVVGDSIAQETLEAIRRVVGYAEPVMVSLDSDHSAAHVRAEMEAYGALVTPGSYMVAEDSILSWLPTSSPPRYGLAGTPMEAVEDFLATQKAWEVDLDVEGMFPATQNPGAWLRRLR